MPILYHLVSLMSARASVHCSSGAKQPMITKSHLLVVALLQVALLGPTNAADRKPDECGLASFYSNVSEETASGEDTQAEDFTAAYRKLPFGTLVHVNNQDNGRYTVMRITDRGPVCRRKNNRRIAGRRTPTRHFRSDAGLSQHHMGSRKSIRQGKMIVDRRSGRLAHN